MSGTMKHDVQLKLHQCLARQSLLTGGRPLKMGVCYIKSGFLCKDFSDHHHRVKIEMIWKFTDEIILCYTSYMYRLIDALEYKVCFWFVCGLVASVT